MLVFSHTLCKIIKKNVGSIFNEPLNVENIFCDENSVTPGGNKVKTGI